MTLPIGFDSTASLLNYNFSPISTSSLFSEAANYNFLTSVPEGNDQYINQALSAIQPTSMGFPTYNLADIQSQVTGPGSALAMSGQMENSFLLSSLSQANSVIPGMPTDNTGLPYYLLSQLPMVGTNLDTYL